MTIPKSLEHLLPWAQNKTRSLLLKPLSGPDTRGYFIYTEEEMALYYAQPPQIQWEWQRYAEAEAKAFNDANSYDKQVYLYHQWQPDLSFTEWLKKQATS